MYGKVMKTVAFTEIKLMSVFVVSPVNEQEYAFRNLKIVAALVKISQAFAVKLYSKVSSRILSSDGWVGEGMWFSGCVGALRGGIVGGHSEKVAMCQQLTCLKDWSTTAQPLVKNSVV